MTGTDIPTRFERTGGVMADPVLNNMFIYPNLDNLLYHIPYHENMGQDWLTKNWFDSEEIDAQIDDEINNLERDGYEELDAQIDDYVNDLFRECYDELDARRY